MNIVILSEVESIGKIDKNAYGMRTDTTFCKAIDATHINFNDFLTGNVNFIEDIKAANFFIIIPSKKYPQCLKVPLILYERNIPFGIMQEGPNLYWQTWTSNYQVLYLTIIRDYANVIFCHNEYDKKYFSGITNKPIIVVPTTHLVNIAARDIIKPEDKSERVFIGGNMTTWYNGMTSFLIANHSSIKEIAIPSMGRRQEDEDKIMPQLDERVRYYPYLEWAKFMQVLRHYKYAVHLMPTIAAGSFSLNCAMLGIPCIGNKEDDTQRICFPDLAIDINDTKQAKELMYKLVTDKDFYSMVRAKALLNVKQFDVSIVGPKLLKEIEAVLK